MQIVFLLVATGSVVQPQLNVAVFADTAEEAITEAEKIVAQLHLADYHRFTLYDTSRKESDADLNIADFRCSTPALVVHTTK